MVKDVYPWYCKTAANRQHMGQRCAVELEHWREVRQWFYGLKDKTARMQSRSKFEQAFAELRRAYERTMTMKQTIQQMASDLADRAVEIGLTAEQMPNDFAGGAVVIELKAAITAMQRARDALRHAAQQERKR